MIYERILQPKPYASKFFKARDGVNAAIPRYRFMFYANFIANPEAISFANLSSERHGSLDYNRLGDWENGISFKIHGIDKPNVALTTVELNQYNRKRYAYTKVDYQQLNIKMYDTVDDNPLALWRDYFNYYFGDSRNGDLTARYNQPAVISSFENSLGWGFNPVANELNFFKEIELYAMYGKRFTKISYIHPKITKIDWNSYDSSSSEAAEMSMTLQYEAITYKLNQPITTKEATMFGFAFENPLEVSTSRVEIERQTTGTGVREFLSSLLPTNVFSFSGITNIFNSANTNLNMFSGNNLNNSELIVSQSSASANQIVTGAIDPGLPAQYIGSQPSVTATRASSVLTPYGSFIFGK